MNRRLSFTSRSILLTIIAALVSLTPMALEAQKLTPARRFSNGQFGHSVAASGGNAIAGALRNDGTAHFFKDVDLLSGISSADITETVTLEVSDLSTISRFGHSVALSSDSAIVGDLRNQHAGTRTGAAYYYSDLNSVTGDSVTETVKLIHSGGSDQDFFGQSVSLNGDSAVVGAHGRDLQAGSAYYFRNLDSATGPTVSETARLSASDAASSDNFGFSTALSGDNALVGASGKNSQAGSAYYFRGLDSSTGSVINETLKLEASDLIGGFNFGSSVALDGDAAIVGAQGGNGQAYYFRGLDAATGPSVQETFKLVASDRASFDGFGFSVDIEGGNALIGSPFAEDSSSFESSGFAYLFTDLDSGATGTRTETLKLMTSRLEANATFGTSVALDGDILIVGAKRDDFTRGSAYTARISNITTLDEGNTSRQHSSLDFESATDWIIGDLTDNNVLAFDAAVTAIVDEAGHAVYIGAGADADNNQLILEGTIEASELYIGSQLGNVDNALILADGSLLNVDNVFLASGNELQIEGDFSDFSDMLNYLASSSRPTSLFVDDLSGGWELVDSLNASSLLEATFDSSSGFTSISAIPEPAMGSLIAILGLCSVVRRRRG